MVMPAERTPAAANDRPGWLSGLPCRGCGVQAFPNPEPDPAAIRVAVVMGDEVRAFCSQACAARDGWVWLASKHP